VIPRERYSLQRRTAFGAIFILATFVLTARYAAGQG
jgi:hypothetical protein